MKLTGLQLQVEAANLQTFEHFDPWGSDPLELGAVNCNNIKKITMYLGLATITK